MQFKKSFHQTGEMFLSIRRGRDKRGGKSVEVTPGSQFILNCRANPPSPSFPLLTALFHHYCGKLDLIGDGQYLIAL